MDLRNSSSIADSRFNWSRNSPCVLETEADGGSQKLPGSETVTTMRPVTLNIFRGTVDGKRVGGCGDRDPFPTTVPFYCSDPESRQVAGSGLHSSLTVSGF